MIDIWPAVGGLWNLIEFAGQHLAYISFTGYRTTTMSRYIIHLNGTKSP